jgi:hypothetical protein
MSRETQPPELTLWRTTAHIANEHLDGGTNELSQASRK